MTLIEGMKELKLIEKKIESNKTDVGKYSSGISSEVPAFETSDKQRDQVKGFVQSNLDHQKRFRELKKRIDFTNLMTKVEMNGESFTIADLLLIRRKLAGSMSSTYKALSTHSGDMRKRNTASASGEKVETIRFYDEKWRNEGAQHWDNLYHEIDGRLEVVNATTALLNLPT
ncbi:hypothetical protein KAR91_00655 [Candidatus Pacearchaeota archaeon]|nr:hypothetical protein [Candidatus Pacearchaeota archaeon]